VGIEIVRFWGIFVSISMNSVEAPVSGSGVKEDDIVHCAEPRESLVMVAACTPPNDFVTKILNSEDSVENDLQIVAGRWIAMKV